MAAEAPLNFPPGVWESTVANVARMLRKQGHDEDAIYKLLTERGARSHAARGTPLLDDATLRRIAKSAAAAGPGEAAGPAHEWGPHHGVTRLRRRRREDRGDPEPRGRVELLSYADMKARPTPAYLVDDILVSDGLTSVIGLPKAGKSYWALPMALCVATGRSFFDRPVKQGRVVYVCTEGGIARFRQRVDAWLQHHGIDARELDGRFVLMPTPISLLNEGDADALQLALGDGWDLGVYDTLARTMGGDENSTFDMSSYVDALDRLRGAGANGTQIVVHHAGKTPSRGGRGSNALTGAVEREFIISKPRRGVHIVRIGHDRHGDGSWKEVYLFHPVDIGEEGPTPGVLVRDDDATAVFLDAKTDALIAACSKAPDKVISTAQAIEVVWEAGRKSKPDYKEDSARSWVGRLPKAPQLPHAATGLQRTKDGVRLATEDDGEGE